MPVLSITKPSLLEFAPPESVTRRAFFRVSICILATLIGAMIIRFFVYRVAAEQAGTTAYWSLASALFAGWLLSLANMWRIAIANLVEVRKVKQQ